VNLAMKRSPGPVGHFRGLFLIGLVMSLLASPLSAADKTDQIWLKNGDHLTGEIKKLQLGIFYFKPKYALNSIEIDWTLVDRIDSVERFNVILTNGVTYSGIIRKISESGDAADFTIVDDGMIVQVHRLEVVNIQTQKPSFLAQLNGSIDYGFSYVSGNNQVQSSLGANAAYRGEKNQMSSSLSSSFSGQSDAEDTTRESFSGDYSRILTPKYFLTGLSALLSSSQQQLDLRVTFGGAFGRTLIRTDRTAFAAALGAVASRKSIRPVRQRPIRRRTILKQQPRFWGHWTLPIFALTPTASPAAFVYIPVCPHGDASAWVRKRMSAGSSSRICIGT
jgi:hypothetical protein